MKELNYRLSNKGNDLSGLWVIGFYREWEGRECDFYKMVYLAREEEVIK
jgi:hypothetical protein